jgi:threonine dehydrogenase-like Zn-dependent dehydrogenase
MKAIAVLPGQPNSVHLADLPKPSVTDVPNGRGVLVKVLRVGVDGTDKEINAAEYGAAPPGYDLLVIGHEGFGQVEAVGPRVTEIRPGDYVVATVRRPGTSLYDLIGTSDMTTDDTYFERGINLRHGFLTEHYVDDADLLVKVPRGLREVGVLLEPLTVVEKGIAQAYEINSDLIEAVDARYESTADVPILDGARKFGPFDLIFQATGHSPVVFDSMQALGKNGVLVLSSVTGGDRRVEVPADRINLEFVLGNKVMVGTVNANREYFELGVRDMAQAEAEYAGWLGRLLTHPVRGLERYRELLDQLTTARGAIKVFCEVAALA